MLAKKAANDARAAEIDHFNLDDIKPENSSDTSVVGTTITPAGNGAVPMDFGNQDSLLTQNPVPVAISHDSSAITALTDTPPNSTVVESVAAEHNEHTKPVPIVDIEMSNPLTSVAADATAPVPAAIDENVAKHDVSNVLIASTLLDEEKAVAVAIVHPQVPVSVDDAENSLAGVGDTTKDAIEGEEIKIANDDTTVT